MPTWTTIYHPSDNDFWHISIDFITLLGLLDDVDGSVAVAQLRRWLHRLNVHQPVLPDS